MASQKDMLLAWAIKVDAAKLGAGLEAYLDTKCLKHILSLCVAKSLYSCAQRFTPQIIGRIAEETRLSIYRSRIRDWQATINCVKRLCDGDPATHGARPGHYDYEEQWQYRKGYGGRIDARIKDEHKYRFSQYKRTIARFEKRLKKISDGLSVSLNFMMLDAGREWNKSGFPDDTSDFFAYLTIPISKITLHLHEGLGKAPYKIEQILEPGALDPLPMSEVAKFHQAVDKLSLNAPHTNIMVKDKVHDDWSSNEDSDSSEPESALEVGEDDFQPKPAKKQHLECLECGSAECKGSLSLAFEPELKMLGFAVIEV